METHPIPMIGIVTGIISIITGFGILWTKTPADGLVFGAGIIIGAGFTLLIWMIHLIAIAQRLRK